jgi:hypothetical protein
MFYGASAFHQHIQSWDVSGVIHIGGMFENVADITSCEVSGARYMWAMFCNAHAIAGILDLGMYPDMHAMLEVTLACNRDVGSWDESSVTDRAEMFNWPLAFHQDNKSWDVARVINNVHMFEGCYIRQCDFRPNASRNEESS